MMEKYRESLSGQQARQRRVLAVVFSFWLRIKMIGRGYSGL
jgi:hypothetical protein